jgi:hypothetical protein
MMDIVSMLQVDDVRLKHFRQWLRCGPHTRNIEPEISLRRDC